MILEIPQKEIEGLLLRQLRNFFLIDENEQRIINEILPDAFFKCEHCFLNVQNKYFRREGQAFFSPYHSVQWLTFVCFCASLVSNLSSRTNTFTKEMCKPLADKLYYLNKIMNSIDIYHEVVLPDVFSFEHPLGSIIGRAKLSDGLFIYQGCTIGGNINKDGKIYYPEIGRDFVMFSDSKIIGKCKVGDNVTLSANSYVKDTDIPSNTIVFGQSPNLIFKLKIK